MCLKINSVLVSSTERKVSNVNGRPGVVIAKFRNSADTSKVMSAKSSLKNNRQFPDVLIHTDQTRDDRLISSNFKTIIDAINRGDKLSLHGSRVRHNFNNYNVRDNGHSYSSGNTRNRSDNSSVSTTRPSSNSSANQNSNAQGQNSNSQSQSNWSSVNGRRGGRGNDRRGNGHRGRY